MHAAEPGLLPDIPYSSLSLLRIAPEYRARNIPPALVGCGPKPNLGSGTEFCFTVLFSGSNFPPWFSELQETPGMFELVVPLAAGWRYNTRLLGSFWGWHYSCLLLKLLLILERDSEHQREEKSDFSDCHKTQPVCNSSQQPIRKFSIILQASREILPSLKSEHGDIYSWKWANVKKLSCFFPKANLPASHRARSLVLVAARRNKTQRS